MIDSFKSVFKIPELKQRIIFTLLILIVYRIGGHVPMPGINSEALLAFFDEASQGRGLLSLYDLFAGGAFSRATVFALGIMPYISASIIIQLLGAVVPYFEKLQKEGEEGHSIHSLRHGFDFKYASLRCQYFSRKYSYKRRTCCGSGSRLGLSPVNDDYSGRWYCVNYVAW